MSPGAEINTFRELFATLLWSDEQNITGYWVAKQSLDKLMRHKVAERRAHPTDDLLGMMVQATDDQGKGLSDEQIVAHTNILLVAGHETSTSLVAWFIYLLLSNPEYLTRVMDEQNATLVRRDDPTLEQIKAMKTLHAGLQEAERMYAPVPNGPRGVSTAFEFEGYSVPQGTFVLYGIAASHYNPQIFADPTRFDPDRFLAPREEDKRTPYSLVGFGGGPRICIGINFAQIEIKALVSHLLRNVALTVIAGQEIVQQYGVTGVPKNGIQVNVHALR
jgi:cytochrome P450